MLKQVIFAAMALLLLGQVEGKAIENTTLLPHSPFVFEEAATNDITLPTPLPQGWANVGTIIDGYVAGHAYLDVFQMIQGRVAGVLVSGSSFNYRVRIRGASGPPLVIIDGMRFMGYDDVSLNNLLLSISPADVDYIEVLKRIADTAIYGAGSANGVIVVHTRSAE